LPCFFVSERQEADVNEVSRIASEYMGGGGFHGDFGLA
jgi:hypothetical protein